ncbi:MAG: DUF362 domain-containing protein [Kofleriaceae bacterium]|jgi:hypothetical protein|nr:DUF362 domain-containing protein [Kofleriaceae bacterium]MBP9171177.1 DUF362 domain-containing protein [Kofleriaceae bacterium]MBP9860423.1 DUF362 domain-containing protein [Kofleriaceae bacterium]
MSEKSDKPDTSSRGPSRRKLLLGAGAVAGLAGATWVMRNRIRNFIDRKTVLASFSATPPLLPHDAAKDATTIAVAKGGGPAGNIDAAMSKLGGMGKVIGVDDVVVIKVSAQWWNQGMTNVAAVKRTIEHILEIPGWKGEIIVFENTHFHFPDKAADDPSRGLTRAWTAPSVRNVDVPGWKSLGDLIPHFTGLGVPVSFYGLVDAGPSALAGDPWFDPEHKHGVYGGDRRGPLGKRDVRDGYFWDFDQVFRLKRSRVGSAKTPLSWPRFTSAKSGAVIDLKDGVLRKDGDKLVADGRTLRFINMTTGNEHGSTGFTGACKSPMGLVDMSAGALGTDPRVQGYQSVHYFGRTGRADAHRDPTWRMAGPLAYWNNKVRRADLYLTCCEWVAVTPKEGYDDSDDMRHHDKCAQQVGTVVAGRDPVAIDSWCLRNVMSQFDGKYAPMMKLDDPDSKASRFLRYFREAAGWGTLDPALVTVV